VKQNWKTIAISIPIGGLFLWLAFKNVDFNEVLSSFGKIEKGWWIFWFIFVSVSSYLIRAERWMLLIGENREKAHRTTFIAGTFFGYMMNYIIPRLGEVSRCMYVSKKDDISTVSLIGTVVLERVIDTLMLLLMVVFLFVYVITEDETVIRLFGTKNADLINKIGSWQSILVGLALLIAVYYLLKLVMMGLRKMESKESMIGSIAKKINGLIAVFSTGLSNIKKVHNWPYFIVLTILLWVCYIMMAYIPFYMFSMQETYHLGIADSAILMVLAAVGVALPSPGAIGTYHWFVTQTLFVLYNVPEPIGLAYAFVTHTSMLVLVMGLTPIFLFINTFILRKKNR
jgi:glycosyltransferase 2 family protein